MHTKFLLPHRARIWGWVITLPALVLMLLYLQTGFTFSFLDYAAPDTRHIDFDNGFLATIQFNNFTDELGSILLIIGLLLVAFSKEKDEDERISQIRLESLLWATLVNALLIIGCIILFYNQLFLKIMAYNICSTLLFFIARFNLVLYGERRKIKNTEA